VVKEHAFGLLIGAGLGLLLLLLWKASPFILVGLFLLAMQADNGSGPSGHD
jgi:F0F1-type ATP synthase assembly protein I